MSTVPYDTGYLRNYRTFGEVIYHSLTSNLTPNIIVISKHAKNPDIDQAATEDIWNNGGKRTRILTPGLVEVLSSSANDTALGTGARTVTLYGYDSNLDLIEETVSLNGITPVSTSLTFTDVWRAQVTTAGSTLSNVGTVTVRLATGPVTLCSLPDAEGVSRHSHFIIPAGYTGFMSDINIGLGGAGGAGVGRVALNILDPSNVIRNISDQYITSNSGPIYMPAVGNLELSAGSQIWFDAYSETANSELSVSYTIILVKGVFV